MSFRVGYHHHTPHSQNTQTDISVPIFPYSKIPSFHDIHKTPNMIKKKKPYRQMILQTYPFHQQQFLSSPSLSLSREGRRRKANRPLPSMRRDVLSGMTRYMKIYACPFLHTSSFDCFCFSHPHWLGF